MNVKLHGKLIGLSLIGALLLVLAWQPFSLIPFLFVGFVPLLWIEHTLRKGMYPSYWFLLYAFVLLLGWNIGTTYWLWNATPEGAIAAFLINTLLMLIPWWVYHKAALKYSASTAEWLLLTAWLSFEYLHHTWEFSWPWLQLGNAFAPFPSAIQWYELTGVTGGSFWVLFANIRIYRWWMSRDTYSKPMLFSKAMNLLFFVGFAPLFLSWYILHQYNPSGIPIEVAVVQPNLDPYGEKFNEPGALQTRKMLDLANRVTDRSTRLICFPETALQGGLDELQLDGEPSIQECRNFIAKHPQVSLLTGADSYKFYPAAEKTFSARKYNEDYYYDAFNSAFLIEHNQPIQVYHKAKLVPGVESMPYQQLFGFLGTAAIELGGTSGSLGRNEEAAVMHIGQNQFVAPVICYESVFGAYVASYVRKGAGLLCIITNDGWWGNTAGYRQHFDYASLRAIETRRYIARAANTGISGFFDDKGNSIDATEWWTTDARKATLMYLSGETFYVRNAFYIELLPVLLFALALLRRKQPTL